MFEYLRSIFALYDNARVDLCDAVKEEPFDGKGSERKEKRRKMDKGRKRERGGKKGIDAMVAWSHRYPRTAYPTGRFSGPHSSPPSSFFLHSSSRSLPSSLLFFFPSLCFRVSVESCSFPALPSSLVLSLSRPARKEA